MTCAPTINRLDPWLTHAAHIVRVTPETPGVQTYHLRLDDEKLHTAFAARPGQFNMLYVPGVGESAISVCGPCRGDDLIPHTIRAAGNVTRTLARLGEGGAIGVRGPFGSYWPLDDCRDKDVVLVAGGIGLAPLRAVIGAYLLDPNWCRSLRLLCGSRTPDGLLYQQEYDTWRDHGISISTTVDRDMPGWNGNVGVVTVLLQRMPLNAPGRTVLMTCGPEVMMWYTIQTALQRGLLRTSLYLSLERNMNCAIGLCGHCQFGPQFVCRDGPVFRFDQVESILRTDDL